MVADVFINNMITISQCDIGGVIWKKNRIERGWNINFQLYCWKLVNFVWDIIRSSIKSECNLYKRGAMDRFGSTNGIIRIAI